MSYMKHLVHFCSDGITTRDNLATFKTLLRKAKEKNVNYVIRDGEIWTADQVEGIIELLSKKSKEFK